MNIISVIISIVLTGLMLSVGVFYGGSTYTDSKAEIDAVKIIDIYEKMKTSVKIAESRDIDLTGNSNYIETPNGEPPPPDMVNKLPLDIMLEAGVISEIPKINKENNGFKHDFDLLKTFESGRFINVMKVDINEEKLCSKINDVISGDDSVSEINNSFFDGMPSSLSGYGIVLMSGGGLDMDMSGVRNYTSRCFKSGGVLGNKYNYVFIGIFDSGMAYREFRAAVEADNIHPEPM